MRIFSYALFIFLYMISHLPSFLSLPIIAALWSIREVGYGMEISVQKPIAITSILRYVGFHLLSYLIRTCHSYAVVPTYFYSLVAKLVIIFLISVQQDV